MKKNVNRIDSTDVTALKIRTSNKYRGIFERAMTKLRLCLTDGATIEKRSIDSTPFVFVNGVHYQPYFHDSNYYYYRRPIDKYTTPRIVCVRDFLLFVF